MNKKKMIFILVKLCNNNIYILMKTELDFHLVSILKTELDFHLVTTMNIVESPNLVTTLKTSLGIPIPLPTLPGNQD